MNDEAMRKATGRSGAEWFDLIRQSGKAEAPHKEIADYLRQTHGASAWWAQEITVEFEKQAGRRVLGQTQDGLFQLGVSRTIAAPAQKVWECLASSRGVSLLADADAGVAPGAAAVPPGLRCLEHLDGESSAGVQVSTTTLAAGSHVRLRWRRIAWPSHSILQVRLTPKDAGKTVLSFHQEKLPSLADREELIEHWRRTADAIAEECADT